MELPARLMMKLHWHADAHAPFAVQTSISRYADPMGEPTGTLVNWLSQTRALRFPYANVTTANADIDIHLASDACVDFLHVIELRNKIYWSCF